MKIETKSSEPQAAPLLEPIEVLAVVREVPAPYPDLTAAFARLSLDGEPSFVLEPVSEGALGHFSYLFFQPFETLRIRDGRLLQERLNVRSEISCDNPLSVLRQALARYQPLGQGSPARFASGAVGYLGYDCVPYLERIALPEVASGEDEACFTVFQKALVYDRQARKLFVVGNVFGQGQKLLPHVSQTQAELEEIVRCLQEIAPLRSDALPEVRPHLAEPELAREDFSAAVQSIKEHIGAGDIFQCVLSRRQSFPLKARPFEVYRELCRVNPSPYLFYYHSGAQTLLGSSPELLVRVRDGKIETCPIAGTRPRGKNEEEDHRRERALRRSQKERAEHLMLVDLGRNDLGRVCRPGTVRVRDFMQVQRFSHVMHLVSTVEGELAEGHSSLDALFACFPAGTLTGAPKIRAMQIISELEPVRRGAYGGAVVLYDFSGDLETCITIRSLVVVEGLAHIQAGAGIVADSRPQAEFEEIEHKSQAVRQSVARAEGRRQ